MLKFVRDRLAGNIALSDAFFHDMLAIGSLVNIAIGLCAFTLIAADLPVWIPVSLLLAPQPYNIILLISVWRAAERSQTRGSDFMRAAAVLWFVIMIFV